jgi:hypothetical protein
MVEKNLPSHSIFSEHEGYPFGDEGSLTWRLKTENHHLTIAERLDVIEITGKQSMGENLAISTMIPCPTQLTTPSGFHTQAPTDDKTKFKIHWKTSFSTHHRRYWLSLVFVRLISAKSWETTIDEENMQYLQSNDDTPAKENQTGQSVSFIYRLWFVF